MWLIGQFQNPHDGNAKRSFYSVCVLTILLHEIGIRKVFIYLYIYQIKIYCITLSIN